VLSDEVDLSGDVLLIKLAISSLPAEEADLVPSLWSTTFWDPKTVNRRPVAPSSPPVAAFLQTSLRSPLRPRDHLEAPESLTFRPALRGMPWGAACDRYTGLSPSFRTEDGTAWRARSMG
jgi:hypothetical protein